MIMLETVWIMSVMLVTCLTSWESIFSYSKLGKLEAGISFAMLPVRAVVALLMRGIPHFCGEEVGFIASP